MKIILASSSKQRKDIFDMNGGKMGRYIDVRRLRKDLMDYYGTAMNNVFNVAIIDIGKIETASDKEIIEIAENIGINLEKYIENDMER